MTIAFIIPFKNFELLEYLFAHIGKIRKLKCYLTYNIFKDVKDEIEKNKIIDNLDWVNENEYMDKIFEIIQSDEFADNNYLEYFFPFNNYLDLEKLKYESKINVLGNFPIVRKHGCYSIKNEYLLSKLDNNKEKEIFLKYFDIYNNNGKKN